MSASETASRIYVDGSLVIAPMPAAVSRDTMATGPTASWREVPKTAYKIRGIVEA